MKLIENIVNNPDRAKTLIRERLQELILKRLEESKEYIAHSLLDLQEEYLDENINLVNLGRMTKIRRRIRRDKSGKIIIQRNVRRSAMKGYRVSGTSIRRISPAQTFRRSQQLKRAWRTTRRAKLSRSLLRRKMSLRRRYSLGL